MLFLLPFVVLQAVPGAQPEPKPIIVNIIDPPSDIVSLGEVLLGALGLTGIIVVGALAFGVVTAGAMFWVRSRQTADDLDVTPHGPDVPRG